MDFPAVKVFLEEVFGGFPFFRRQGVNFSNFWSKGVVEVDLVVVGSGWRDMIGGFFGEDCGVVSEFRRKGLLGFCFFGSGGELHGGGDLGYFFFQGGTSVEKAGSTSDDPVEGSVCICVG